MSDHNVYRHIATGWIATIPPDRLVPDGWRKLTDKEYHKWQHSNRLLAQQENGDIDACII